MKFFLIIISLTCILQCTAQKEDKYFDSRFKVVKAKITKIEAKNNIYVYHFKNDTLSGVFAKEKICDNSLKFWKSVKLNKTYKLVLHPMLVASTRISNTRISINGDFVWDTTMKEVYFDNCNNICGDKIYEVQ